MHKYIDVEWAACPITWRSMKGGNVMLAEGTVGCKVGLLPIVVMSSTEAEFMELVVMGRMFLYCRSVMWDLGMSRRVASIAYEDNGVCTIMVQTQKLTPGAWHIAIKYHVVCQEVEGDLIELERI